jgi:aspartyl-tRNA(Asn)/glutamyl-tRNA(Gln) amidotransferase subunit A
MTPSPHRFDAGFETAVIEAGLAGLAPAYAGGTLDPIRVVAAYQSRIASLDGMVGAYVGLAAERAGADAAASAERWSRGAALSPLDGVPLAIKSNIAVAGLPWTAGLGARRNHLARQDADCVAHLRRAGAVILGTVNMDEAALGAMTDNPWFGRTRNPYRLDHIAGGSSGGAAAAVAAGLCAAALGTDTFGSVRIPASYCGVFGHKPAFGHIVRNRVLPLAPAMDTIGFLARSAADCKILADLFDLPQGIERSGAVVGVAAFDGDLAPVGAGLRRLMMELGIAFEPLDMDSGQFFRAMPQALVIATFQAARTYRDLLSDPSAEISRRLRALLERGRGQPRTALRLAKSVLIDEKTDFLQRIGSFRAVLLPTTATVAPRRQEADDRAAARFTLAASLGKLPAVAFPFGCNGDGLPYSVQLIGQCDRTVLDLADQLAILPPPPRFLS